MDDLGSVLQRESYFGIILDKSKKLSIVQILKILFFQFQTLDIWSFYGQRENF